MGRRIIVEPTNCLNFDQVYATERERQVFLETLNEVAGPQLGYKIGELVTPNVPLAYEEGESEGEGDNYQKTFTHMELEKLKEENEAKGIEKGFKLGQEQIVRKMIDKGWKDQDICFIADVSPRLVAKLRAEMA
jgi:hypothetical protein